MDYRENLSVSGRRHSRLTLWGDGIRRVRLLIGVLVPYCPYMPPQLISEHLLISE